jgi:importin subunit alpha-6/7
LKAFIKCVPYLVNVISGDFSNDVLIDACWAFSYLSDGDVQNIQCVIDYNGIVPLIKLLTHDSQDVVVPALRTIGNIVTGTDQQTNCFIKNNGLPSLLTLLNHPKKSIRKEVLWTLSNISAGDRSQIQSIVDAGIFPQIFQMIKTEDEEVAIEATWILSNALAGSSNEQIEFLVAAGALQIIIDVLDDEISEKMEKILVEGLEVILKSDDEYSKKFSRLGGLEMLKSKGDDEIMDKLSHFFSGMDM